MAVLVVAEHDTGSVRSGTLHTVTAASLLGADIHLLLVGHNCAAAARQAATIHGVSVVRCVDAAHYDDQGPENLAALVGLVAADYSHVLLPATTLGKNVAPRVAAALDVAQISDIVAIDGPDQFVRPTYAGNVLTTIRSADSIKIITVRTTAFEPASFDGHAVVEQLDAGPDLGLSRLIGRELSISERPELTSAKIIVSGGRGMGSGENYARMLEPLADGLGAALGASRAAVDAGFVGNDHQVGQTGKIVAPELYIAVGISGAIQHLAGMKDSKIIVAINKDAEAPIFQVADFGVVGDLFQVVPELVTALAEARHIT